ASGAGFGGVTLNTGDHLKVFAISGAFLTNDGSISTASFDGSTLTPWTGSAAPSGWDSIDHGDYIGYEKHSPFASPFTDDIAMSDSGTQSGKNLTGAKKFGDFNFGAITFDSTQATFLGMDVIGDVYNADGTLKGTANTGRIRVEGFVPEGSSLLLLACGL